jgi:hypothetical protein
LEPSATRATLALTRACNNACLFCAQDGLAPLSDADAAGALERLAGTATELTFVGGEPTLHPELLSLVRRARALGFLRVGLQTNGRRLKDSAWTRALVEAGLTDVHVTVLGAEAAVHDYHTGVDGSLAELLAGVAAVRAHALPVVATTVLTRSNYRVLSALPSLLASRGVAAWQVTTTQTAGRAVAGFDRLAPRLALALPYALHAVASAHRLGLRAGVSGVPLCLLGPVAAHAGPGAPRTFAPPCEACPARASCPGVDATYLARFGADELVALSAPPPSPATADALTRCFTGPGELAWPARVDVPEPPAAARARLGDLGKGTPAVAEVAGPPKKSGEALRGIFPSLFEAPDRKG